jgi:tetratricopeptide (TPR) repeat protein
MIPRYSRPEMAEIWSPETRYRIWFEIEAHATDKLAELGVVPAAAAEAVWKAKDMNFDIARIDDIEREVKHDVIAFLTHLAELVGDDARFVHQGLTSSDVLDTCLAVQLRDASDILLAGLDRLLAALKARALEHRMTVCIGRSHGIHAEPVTFGLKLASFHAEFARNRERLVRAREEIATCAISGAVGTFANVSPEVEAHVADKLGLAVEPVSTQVIPRDRHAAFFAALGLIAMGETELGARRMLTNAEFAVTASDATRAIMYGQAGDAFLMASLPDRALTAFQRGRDFAPLDAGLALGAADAAQAAGRWDVVEDAASAAIELNADEARAWRHRSEARLEAGDLDAAESDMEEARRLDPDDIEALLLRGRINEARRGAPPIE